MHTFGNLFLKSAFYDISPDYIDLFYGDTQTSAFSAVTYSCSSVLEIFYKENTHIEVISVTTQENIFIH